MSKVRRGPKSTRPWQKFLTPAERDRIIEIDRLLETNAAESAQLSWERHQIQNRATQRVK